MLLLDLVKAAAVQGDLFHGPDDARSLARMKALDALNARYGRDTVTIGGTARKRAWRLRSDQRSASYTTDWGELLAV